LHANAKKSEEKGGKRERGKEGVMSLFTFAPPFKMKSMLVFCLKGKMVRIDYGLATRKKRGWKKEKKREGATPRKDAASKGGQEQLFFVLVRKGGGLE